MEKRDDTSETTIGMLILVMNLEKIMRDLLFVFFIWRESNGTIISSKLFFNEKEAKSSKMAA